MKLAKVFQNKNDISKLGLYLSFDLQYLKQYCNNFITWSSSVLVFVFLCVNWCNLWNYQSYESIVSTHCIRNSLWNPYGDFTGSPSRGLYLYTWTNCYVLCFWQTKNKLIMLKVLKELSGKGNNFHDEGQQEGNNKSQVCNIQVWIHNKSQVCNMTNHMYATKEVTCMQNNKSHVCNIRNHRYVTYESQVCIITNYRCAV